MTEVRVLHQRTGISQERAALQLAGLGALVLAVVLPVGELRFALALPLAVAVPASALAGVAVPAPARLHPLLQAAVGVMLAVAAYPLAALALYAAGIALTAGSVLVVVAIVVTTATAASLQRARGVRRADRRRLGRHGLWTTVALLVVAAAGISYAAFVRALPQPAASPFAELSFRGVQLAARRHALVLVDVANRSSSTRRYRLTAATTAGWFSLEQPSVVVAPGGHALVGVPGRVQARCAADVAVQLLDGTRVTAMLHVPVVGPDAPASTPACRARPHR